MPPSAWKAILFDLDGTLFNRDATVEGIVEWQVTAFSSLIPAERAAEFRRMVVDLDDHGHRDKREVYARVGAAFSLDSMQVEQLVASFWNEYPKHCHPGPQVLGTLTALRVGGTRLGIITNGFASVDSLQVLVLAHLYSRNCSSFHLL